MTITVTTKDGQKLETTQPVCIFIENARDVTPITRFVMNGYEYQIKAMPTGCARMEK